MNQKLKLWTGDLVEEPQAFQQMLNTASLPIVWPWLAGMPDRHLGIGATVGSVVPTRGAVIPACAGVDLGCGMMAVETMIDANAISPQKIFDAIENSVPVGKGGKGGAGTWAGPKFDQDPAERSRYWFAHLGPEYEGLVKKHPKIQHGLAYDSLGTLGSGNHFIEVCIEPNLSDPKLWVMLHSGSRGPGNKIGQYFIHEAWEQWQKNPDRIKLPDRDLAWLDEGTQIFDDYMEAVWWAQGFAQANRHLMMKIILDLLDKFVPGFQLGNIAVNCHHNYVQMEQHFGENLYITRKGAISAKDGELGIIPGSMGAKSFIVRGKGNADSFHSSSHGAGRSKSRGAAKKEISLEQHRAALQGVACRADASTLDESPDAYKDIDQVMAAQTDLVEIVTTLRQIVCVKG